MYKLILLLTVILGGFLTLSSGSSSIEAATGPQGSVTLRRIHAAAATAKSPSGITSATSTYHSGATLRCSDCHVMHESKQHPIGEELSPDPFGGYPQQFVGGPKLLKTPDPIDLCLTCHNGQTGIPDVMGADVNGLTERSAGFFDAVGTRNPRGHSLDRGQSIEGSALCDRCHFGGTFATASVTCIDCHNPHGNGRARNLQWASYPGGEPPFGLLEAATATGLQRYEASNVAYGTDNTDNLREVTNMCVDCHHVFTGEYYTDPDGNGWHNRHPSYESERLSTNNIAQGAARGTTDPAHWATGAGVGFGATPRLRFVNDGAVNFTDAMVVDPAKNGVFCLSCHQAHGNSHSFALRWDPAAAIPGDGCDQCHAKNGS